MPAPDLYQGIVDGDEIALRDAFRRYGAVARALALRIAGPERADDIVEEAFLLIWTDPQRWASDALDAHLLRIVRDLALAVRRRGVAPSVAVRDLGPAPHPPSVHLPDVIAELDQRDLQRLMLTLPDNQGSMLEDAWVEGHRGDDELLSAGLEAVATHLQSRPSR